MSQFVVIKAESTTNYVLNPSAELVGNFVSLGGAVVWRSTAASLYALYSYYVTTSADNDGISLTLSALSNNVHYATARISVPVSWTTWDWSVDNANYHTPTHLLDLDGDWALWGVEFPAAQCNGSTTLYIRQDGAGSGNYFMDGVQVEQKAYWTTFCDGSLDGCEWNGAAHASTSARSAVSRAGGRPYDLVDDLGFEVISSFIGAGVHPVTHHLQGYALLPGALWKSAKDEVRQLAVTGPLRADDLRDLHSKRAELTELFTRDHLGQPALFRYSGDDVVKEIPVRYTQGLELGQVRNTLTPIPGDDQGVRLASPFQDTEDTQRETLRETVNLRLLAEQPYWEQIGETSAILDTNDTITVRTITARINGVWDDLGPPNVAGTYTAIYAITEGPDGTIYVGGDFVNFDNIANADYIVQYDPQTGTWSALGTGANGIVRALVVGPDGNLYAGGAFALMGGVANTSRIAMWNGAAWSALGTGAANNTVYALDIGPVGEVYAGGDFTQMGGVANTDEIAYWDGAAWNAMVSGVGGGGSVVYAVAARDDGTVYAGGDFTTIGAITVNNVGRWDGTAWNAMAAGSDAVINALAIGTDGSTLYAGGDFLTIGGESINRIASWNGIFWSTLGAGANSAVTCLAVAPDGTLYAGCGGVAGCIALSVGCAKWNGYSWAHLDIDLPGAPVVRAIAIAAPDPVIASNYDTWLGFDTTGTAAISGTTTITNSGSTIFLPVLTVERSGGTSALLTNVRNETTGKELLFDYDLLDGEVLTVDLRPGRQAVTSSFSGNRPDAVLKGSNFSDFSLLHSLNGGQNVISALVIVAGGGTIEAALRGRLGYKSFDD